MGACQGFPWLAGGVGMECRFEILSRFEEPFPAGKVLYQEPDRPLSCRSTRAYRFRYRGERDAVEAFTVRCLLDEVSEEIRSGESWVWPEASLRLEYGFKPGALDLEKEAIQSFYRRLPQPEFEVEGLELRRLVYVFGEVDEGVEKRFVRDLVNEAIHTYRLTKPHA